jgi:CheY-like chemotaxis protein
MPHIMVVDDDHEVRASLTEALQSAGYEVDNAADARTALRRMQEHRPDLLITDVIMPHTDGWALIRSCRADPNLADVRVLVMSGSLRMREIALKHGAQGFLLKPFSMATALKEVARLFESPTTSEYA